MPRRSPYNEYDRSITRTFRTKRLAEICRAQGDLAPADPFCRRALRVFESSHKLDQSNAARSLLRRIADDVRTTSVPMAKRMHLRDQIVRNCPLVCVSVRNSVTVDVRPTMIICSQHFGRVRRNLKPRPCQNQDDSLEQRVCDGLQQLGYSCPGVVRPTVDQVGAALCAIVAGVIEPFRLTYQRSLCINLHSFYMTC